MRKGVGWGRVKPDLGVRVRGEVGREIPQHR